VSESHINTAVRGSYFLADYELRITTRCLAEDFGVSPETPIGDLLDHPIVKALIKDRATDPDAGKTIGPEAGEDTIRRLGYGHDHRGGTWWDRAEKVVWLCAYHGKHRSGGADDPFKKHFPELIAARRMKPTAVDYEALFAERDERFVDLVHGDAQALLAEARREPGTEKRAVIGGEANVGCVVEVVETLDETYVAFFIEEVTYERFVILLNAFYVSRFEEWEQVHEMPHRQIDEASGEVCYRYLRGT
jgi:hypothetical protein